MNDNSLGVRFGISVNTVASIYWGPALG